MSKKWIALVLVIAIMLSLAACGGNSASQGTEAAAKSEQAPAEAGASTATTTKETLTIALPVEPATLDPFAHSNQNGFICTSLVLEPLIKKNDDGELIPWLATSWEYVDDTTLHFSLRDDVTFHDGSKLTAKDVKFTLARLAQSSFTSTFFQCIDYENITIEDDYNLTVKLLYTYAPPAGGSGHPACRYRQRRHLQRDGSGCFCPESRGYRPHEVHPLGHWRPH